MNQYYSSVCIYTYIIRIISFNNHVIISWITLNHHTHPILNKTLIYERIEYHKSYHWRTIGITIRSMKDPLNYHISTIFDHHFWSVWTPSHRASPSRHPIAAEEKKTILWSIGVPPCLVKLPHGGQDVGQPGKAERATKFGGEIHGISIGNPWNSRGNPWKSRGKSMEIQGKSVGNPPFLLRHHWFFVSGSRQILQSK